MKELVIAALNLKHKNFIVYITALYIDSGDEVYSLKKSQIT